MGFMEYMSENLGESRLFDHSFIGLLKVIRVSLPILFLV